MSFRIRRDDMVIVVAGKDRGIRGKVLAVYPDKQRVLVEGVNMVKHHKRRRQVRGGTEGGIVEREAPIHLSNVMLVDPKSSRPTRIGMQRTADGVRQRIAKRSGTPV